MNVKKSLLLTALSLIATLGAQAQTAYTDPVGYVTTSLAENTAGTQTGADTLVGPTLVNKPDYQGVSTNDPSGSTSITFASGVPAGLTATHYIEIESGVRAGWWSSIASTTATGVTTVDALPAGLAVGTRLIVRKHVTLLDFLGANTPGLKTFDTDSANPDKVLVLDPVTQVVKPYVYATAAFGPAGFYDQVTEESADAVIIYPGSAVKIRRTSTGPLSLTRVGHVKKTPTEVDIFVRDNWVESVNAVGVTLGGSGLNTGNLLSGLVQEDYNAANGAPDRLLLISPSQVTTSYVALTGAGGIIDEVSETSAQATEVIQARGFIIRRDPAIGAGSTWTAPAPTISQP
jgi:hypothetical protein